MGHQVNFFLDDDDTKQLELCWRSLEPMLVLHSRSTRPEPRLLKTVLHEEMGEQWLFYYLVRPEDLGAVVLEHVPAQGYWSVDVLTSPVVEVNRCFFDGTILRRGRLYYVDGFYDANQQWEEKPVAFRDWAEKLLARTRSRLKKYKTDYIGEGARAWLGTSGGRLVT